jgi:TonB-linked SusC/RagA family outer membrane protein
MKKHYDLWVFEHPILKKLIMELKIAILITIATVSNVFSTPSYSQVARVSLEIRNGNLEQVMDEIEKQSEFYFIFNQKQIDVTREVDIKVENKLITDVLPELFSGTNVRYAVFDRKILLTNDQKEITLPGNLSDVVQQQHVTGTILDENGKPIPGVNIAVEGTTIGSISDINGIYSINVSSQDAVLIFSFIGYNQKRVPVAGKTVINVSMEPSVSSLDEVIVIGYGVTKKRDITGSIASVKSDALQNLTMTDAAHALQGKAAGVQVVNSSGAPGKGASIQIRGYSSNSRTEPLIIVDGLKVTSMDYLDPENIESIEILKDAASAAIYGIEAGNGVILVSTKSGSSATGQGRFFYNYQLTSQKIDNLPQVMNAAQYMEYVVESGAVGIEDFEYDGVTDTHWGDYMFETGYIKRHTLGFEGGNDRGNLFISLNYLDNNGIITGDKDIYKRLTGQINADYKIKDWMTIGVTTSIENAKTNTVSEGSVPNISVLGSIMVYDPITPWTYIPGQEPSRIKTWEAQGHLLPRDENGNIYGESIFSGNTLIWHPAIMRDRTDTDNKNFNLRGTGYINFTPIGGLTFTSRLGYRAGYSQISNYNYDLYINSTANQAMSINGRASNSLYYQWENFANYMINIHEHNITAMAGMSFQHSESEFVYGSANTLSNPAVNFRYLSNAVNSTQMSISGQPDLSTNMSYYGRLGWSYMNKYNLQVSFRADAYDTSKLDKSHRWGYFPSISGGWTISNEPFMDNINAMLGMSSLKLRASYGVNGNVNALSNYQYNTTLSTGINYGYDFGSGSGQITGTYPSSRLPNPDIVWETTHMVDIGADARFFRDRLTVGFDWYNKNTHDLLTSTAAPANTGASTVFVNAGKVNNKGLELELGWKDKISDFNYSISGNIATLKNLVTEGTSKDRVPGAAVHTSGTVTYFEEGYPLWYLRTYVIESINPETGAAVYKDFDNNNIINTDDREMTGSVIPDYTYSLTVNLAYKNFDLTVFGTGVQGAEKLFALNRGDYPQANTLLEFYENRWTPTNKNSKYPKPNYFDQNYKVSDAMVFDASFFKIKQIQLGYNIPKSIINKAKIAGLRAYVSLDDWFTFTKYPGLDPETNGLDRDVNSLGIDSGNYPISKKLVFGLNVSF